MEIILGLVILAVVLFVVGLMVLGAWGIWWFATNESRTKRQAAEAATTLTDTFDGDSRLVTFQVSTLRAHPTQAEVIEAADTFGYHLTNATSQRYGTTLVFEKREG
jgi:VCBS repeat-containing protein